MIFTGRSPEVLRVCHVGRDIGRTGGGEVLRQIVNGSAAEFVLTVITDTPRDRCGLSDAVRVVNTPLGQRLLAWSPSSRFGWILRHALQIWFFSLFSSAIVLLRRREFDVVFNHNCEALVGDVVVFHNVFTFEFLQRKLSRRRRVLSLANPIRFMRLAKEWYLTRSLRRHFVALSVSSVREVSSVVRRSNAITRIDNGVALADYPLSVRPVGDLRNLLFVGQEFSRKGLGELLEALARLKESGYVLRVVGGEAEDLSSWRRRCESLGLESSVHFLGSQDARPHYLWADAFLLPSHYESMPMAALEALASGVPVLLSEPARASELVVPDVNGVACRPESLSIEAALIRLSEIVPGVSRNRVRDTVALRDWSVVVEQYSDLSRAVARERARR